MPGSESRAQLVRTRTDEMGMPTQYPDYTAIYEIDMRQIDGDGNPLSPNSS